MKASSNIKEFIKQAEGLKLEAYLCPSRKWTIGYGHTGPEVRPGMTITAAIASELFEADLARFEQQLNDLTAAWRVGLTQNQHDALLSFAYNVGMANLRSSTLWRKVRTNPSDASIPDEFRRWVYGTQDGKKVKLPGLVARRKAEAQIWNAG